MQSWVSDGARESPYLDDRQEARSGHNVGPPIPDATSIGKHLGDHGAGRRVGGHACGAGASGVLAVTSCRHAALNRATEFFEFGVDPLQKKFRRPRCHFRARRHIPRNMDCPAPQTDHVSRASMEVDEWAPVRISKARLAKDKEKQASRLFAPIKIEFKSEAAFLKWTLYSLHISFAGMLVLSTLDWNSQWRYAGLAFLALGMGITLQNQFGGFVQYCTIKWTNQFYLQFSSQAAF
jgi:hypothetical protein